eukprot:CAMPEP_0174280844 /NCGR_PEP_ID=MMETSP0809-20121228/1168_1 /TAXON_ID=73025 ORGANISM="Eutreptiella gymnastica-like, Strain CCMP1594" /NCGR_SAMPLE_ID=MMETSP0809 /ASSEMBLY_ACC=CAM_ASM_000658 /LENGTH=165 /DNA_ID=CAMNT_0015374001 /DNA_START=75 /DNA_END=574 /DNA_ORIENTATION=+
MSELADVSGKSDPSRHRMNCAQNWRTEFVAQKPPPRGITDFHMARGWFLAELSACRAPGASRGQRQQKRSPQMVNSGANNGRMGSTSGGCGLTEGGGPENNDKLSKAHKRNAWSGEEDQVSSAWSATALSRKRGSGTAQSTLTLREHVRKSRQPQLSSEKRGGDV